MTQWISLSALKTLSSHERGVVWHQFTKVTKEGSYYRVKCNLCSDEDVFLQVRLKTMRYHLWIKHKDFYVENLGDEPQLYASNSSASTLSSASSFGTASNNNPVTKKSKPETTKKRVWLESWVEKSMTKNEVEVFEIRLIEMVADSNMPFEWIEKNLLTDF